MRSPLRLLLAAALCTVLLFCLGSAAMAETLYLPSDLEVIGEEAFYGDKSLDVVQIPSGVRTIGARAFAESGVKKVYIPDSVTTIGADAFLHTGVTIISSSKSYACSYAAKNGLNWQASSVPLTEAFFPDANFRAYVGQFDTDGNGVLSEAEIGAVDSINCGVLGIASLQGIEYFSALTFLVCSENQLTSLNLSGCSSLTWLFCDNNRLTSLDLSGCTELWQLDCRNNRLTSLDLRSCPDCYVDCDSGVTIIWK